MIRKGIHREKELRVLRSGEVTKWRARAEGRTLNRGKTLLPLRGRKAAEALERVLVDVGPPVELRSCDLSDLEIWWQSERQAVEKEERRVGPRDTREG